MVQAYVQQTLGCYGTLRGLLKDRASKDWGVGETSDMRAQGMPGFSLEFLHLFIYLFIYLFFLL